MAFLDNDDDVWAGEPGTEVIEDAEPVVETKEETPEQGEPEQQPETTEAQTAEEKFNPTLYREMKEERAKRQALERENAELRSNRPAPQPQAPVKIPDAYEDPEGFARHFQNVQEQSAWNVRAEMSGRFAEQKFGKDVVEEALTWAQSQAKADPSLEIRVRNAASPVEHVVNEYQQSRTLERIGGKTFEEAASEYAKSQGWIVSPESQPASPSLEPSRPRVPKGLSSAPGTGGVARVQNADWGEVKFALDR